jgi:dUTP pyrophosphatase
MIGPMSLGLVIKVDGTGSLPEYGSAAAAGADLKASANVVIAPGGRAAVPTALHLEIPAGHVGLIWPRSGLAVRHGIDTLAGVVDSDYRGEVRVVLINHGEEPFAIRPGDRIAQLLVQKVERVSFEGVSQLSETARGAAGFGSTGR